MTKSKLLLMVGLCCLLVACSEKANRETPQDYQLGVHYQHVNTYNEGAKQPQLIEFFWYGCSHCQTLAPALTHWQAEHSEVLVDYVPVVWDRVSRLHAQVFYLLKQQEDFEQWHRLMFYTVSQFSRTDGYDEQKQQLTAMLLENGLPEEQVQQTVDGWLFAEQVNEAMAQAKHFGVSSVPAVIVNQQYKVLNQSLKSVGAILPVADYLLSK